MLVFRTICTLKGLIYIFILFIFISYINKITYKTVISKIDFKLLDLILIK